MRELALQRRLQLLLGPLIASNDRPDSRERQAGHARRRHGACAADVCLQVSEADPIAGIRKLDEWLLAPVRQGVDADGAFLDAIDMGFGVAFAEEERSAGDRAGRR